jgi:hypothetical protein
MFIVILVASSRIQPFDLFTAYIKNNWGKGKAGTHPVILTSLATILSSCD